MKPKFTGGLDTTLKGKSKSKMPTTLILKYYAYVTVSVPNKIARELRKQKGVYPDNCTEQMPWSWGSKWGNIGYYDDKGEHHEIEGDGINYDDIDYKRPDGCDWDIEEESVVDESEHIECEKCNHEHAVDDDKACHESGDEGEKPVSAPAMNLRKCVVCTDMYYYDEEEAEKGKCETTCQDCIEKANWGYDSDSDSE